MALAPQLTFRRAHPRRGERGASVIEFALVAPLMFVLLFGILDFGMAMNDLSSMRQGVREAGRQGAVANFGSTDVCALTGVGSGTSTDVRKLMCFTKSSVGLGNDTRVKVMFTDPTLQTQNSTGWSVDNGLVICTTKGVTSKTGMFTPALSSKYITSKTAFRIEQPSDTTQRDGAETDPSGRNWSWCHG